MGDANHLAAHAPPSGPDDDNSLLTGLGQGKLRIHTAQRFTRSLHSASVIGDMDDDDADADGGADADADADELGGELLPLTLNPNPNPSPDPTPTPTPTPTLTLTLTLTLTPTLSRWGATARSRLLE